MTGKLFVAISAAFIFTALVLILRQMLFAPVKLGRNTEQYIILRVFGCEPKLESTLSSLLWLAENSIIRGEVVILGYDLEENTLLCAKDYAERYKGIIFIQDGEISQWIRNLNL